MAKEAEDGRQIPAVGLGTFGIGGGMTADTSSDREHVEALRKAFELGYSHIDTAKVYADGHKALEGSLTRLGIDSVEQLEEARRHCDSAVVTNQVPYGLNDRSYDANGMLAYCRENGVLLTAYSPIKKASLTDPTVKEIAEERGATPAQIALAWLVAQPQVITILKAADPGHLAENWKALDIELSDQDMERLSGLS